MSAGADVAVRVTADISNAQTGLRTLASGFNGIETTALSVTRRTVNGIQGLASSINGLYDAQQRLNVAQISYTLAVREYGAGSIQAARAQDQLKVATNGLALAQFQLNLRYVQFAVSIGPQLYSMFYKLIGASQALGLQNIIEAGTWQAKAAAIFLAAGALALVTFGVSALLGGFAAGANVTNTINQQNTFNGGGTANQQNMVDYTNQSLASSLGSYG